MSRTFAYDRLRKPILVAFIGTISIGCMASIASNAGLCVSEGKLLQSADFFSGAVNAVIHDPIDGVTEHVPSAIILKSVSSRRYSTPDEFLREFAACCKFLTTPYDDGPVLTFWDNVRGNRLVEVSYIKRYAGDDGAPKSAPVSAKVVVTSCGVGLPIR